MKKLVSACLMAALASSAHATVITFEGYSDPTTSGSFTDSGATFIPLAGTTEFEISTYGVPSWGTGAPMILCPRTVSNYCGGDFEVDFASVVNSLTFLFTGDDSVQSLSIEAFLGAASLGTITVFGDGLTGTAQLVDLTSLGDLDRIVVTGASKDPAGYGYDDFTFELAGAIPEPSSWALMIGGLGLAGMALRRRTTRIAFS